MFGRPWDMGALLTCRARAWGWSWVVCHHIVHLFEVYLLPVLAILGELHYVPRAKYYIQHCN